MAQGIAIYTKADQQNVAYGLLNGVIFNDLERPLTYSLTLNISQTATDTTIVTIEGE